MTLSFELCGWFFLLLELQSPPPFKDFVPSSCTSLLELLFLSFSSIHPLVCECTLKTLFSHLSWAKWALRKLSLLTYNEMDEFCKCKWAFLPYGASFYSVHLASHVHWIQSSIIIYFSLSHPWCSLKKMPPHMVMLPHMAMFSPFQLSSISLHMALFLPFMC